MILVFFCTSYAVVVAASYYLAARSAKHIPFPNWVWEREETFGKTDKKRAA